MWFVLFFLCSSQPSESYRKLCRGVRGWRESLFLLPVPLALQQQDWIFALTLASSAPDLSPTHPQLHLGLLYEWALHQNSSWNTGSLASWSLPLCGAIKLKARFPKCVKATWSWSLVTNDPSWNTFPVERWNWLLQTFCLSLGINPIDLQLSVFYCISNRQ